MSAQKYRQKGYMDSDREERPSSKSSPRDRSEGPRGRGLGRPTDAVFRCARCGEKGSLAAEVAFDAVCGSCGDALHACVNCAHFDTSAHNECRQEDASRVAAKSKANSCEFFEPKVAREFAADASSPDDARAAFDALFKF